MASISMIIAPRCEKHAYGEGDRFCYISTACVELEDYHSGGGDFVSPQVTYNEGDDDDDGGYDYAPAA